MKIEGASIKQILPSFEHGHIFEPDKAQAQTRMVRYSYSVDTYYATIVTTVMLGGNTTVNAPIFDGASEFQPI